MSRPRILVVDDAPWAREMLKNLLGEEEYHLFQASDGEEALFVARQCFPDVVILDIVMPGMSGFEVCRGLRAEPHLAEVPILVVSNLDDRESRLRAIEAGADDFLTKPYDKVELQARVRSISRLNRYRRLLEARTQLQGLSERSPDGILLLREGKVLWMNPSARRLLGVEEGAVVQDLDVGSFLLGGRREGFLGGVRPSGEGPGEEPTWEEEFVRRDGTTFMALVASGVCLWEGGEAVQVILRDLTRLKEAEAAFTHLLSHDALTGLPNRELLLRNIRRYFPEDGGRGALSVVRVLGIDRSVRTLGSSFGEAFLRTTAHRLAAALGADGIIGRLGWTDFGIFLPGLVGPAEAERRIQELLEEVRKPFDLDGVPAAPDALAGITLLPEHGEGLADALVQAEAALERASRYESGQALVNPAAESRGRAARDLAAGLRDALAEGRLFMVFQHQVALDTGLQVGVEALVRWDHPTRGALGPGEFLHLAEATGLMLPLTHFALEQASLASSQLGRPPHRMPVAVNLTADALRQGPFKQLVKRIRSLGLAGNHLTLEMTERDLLTSPASAAKILQVLREEGVRISLDDFGTGYSALAYLQTLPVDEIKLDVGTTERLRSDPRARAIVRCILTMARELGILVVAEGIEDDDTLSLLRDMGCPRGQGFYWGHPRVMAELAGGAWTPPSGQEAP